MSCVISYPYSFSDEILYPTWRWPQRQWTKHVVDVDKLRTPDNIVVLWLLCHYRIITLGSNKHIGDDAPWSCSYSFIRSKQTRRSVGRNAFKNVGTSCRCCQKKKKYRNCGSLYLQLSHTAVWQLPYTHLFVQVGDSFRSPTKDIHQLTLSVGSGSNLISHFLAPGFIRLSPETSSRPSQK